MNLKLKFGIANSYTSESQKIRVLTEDWVHNSVYCPNCGHSEIENYPNNRPVADFFCMNCNEEYELKSKKDKIGTKIVDGAFRTMIERLHSNNNPNFFFLNYTLSGLSIINFLVIPKHYFVPELIEKRKPLASTARRAGWVGCNILLQSIPRSGKIFYVKDGQVASKAKVLSEWQKTLFLREEKKVATKGWLIDVIRYIEQLGKSTFTLSEMYAFEPQLQQLHPENKHVKDKIRQQLQILRDKGYLDFKARGEYHLI